MRVITIPKTDSLIKISEPKCFHVQHLLFIAKVFFYKDDIWPSWLKKTTLVTILAVNTKRRENVQSSLCNLESQSLKHMLITCSVSSSFWTCFSNFWHEKFNYKPPLSESTILYGWHKASNNWEVLNYCLIVAKYNVFATSVRNGILDFDSFLLRRNNKIDILRTIAFRSNRLSQFKKTWDKLL